VDLDLILDEMKKRRTKVRKKIKLELVNGKSKGLSINNLFPTISNSKKRRFLIGYAAKGKIKQAAAFSKVDWTYHYRWMREDEEYKKAFEDAGRVKREWAEEQLFMHGFEGIDEPVVYQGRISGIWLNKKGKQVTEGTPGAVLAPLTVKKYAPLCMITYLNANWSEKYRPQGNQSPVNINVDKMFLDIHQRANKEIDVTPGKIEGPKQDQDK